VTPATHRIRCSEVWGGIRAIDLEVSTNGLAASVYSQASEGGSGGDLYYFSVCNSDLLTRIAVADVVGHGPAVSVVSGWMYEALVEQMNSLDGHAILDALNHRACERGLEAMTTAVIVGLYRSDSSLYVSYAGHPPLLLRRRKGQWHSVSLRSPTGPCDMPLGVMSETVYQQRQLPVAAGDRIFIYTDGLIEAPNDAGELFGQERLLAVLERTEEQPACQQQRSVLAAVREHTGGPLSHDDITLMAIQVRGFGAFEDGPAAACVTARCARASNLYPRGSRRP
jgi:sigma-B regulation protein RsbU (phosphoserine phosphatase)